MGLFSFSKDNESGDYTLAVESHRVKVAPGLSILVPVDWEVSDNTGVFKARKPDDSLRLNLQVYEMPEGDLKENLENGKQIFDRLSSAGIDTTGEILRSDNCIAQYFSPLGKEDTDNWQYQAVKALEPNTIASFVIITSAGLDSGNKELIEMIPHTLKRD